MLGTRLKQLAGQSAIYGLGGIVSRLITVFLLPIYTRYLDLWNQLVGGPFNHFIDVTIPSKFGSWGSIEFLGQRRAATHKRRALEAFGKKVNKPRTRRSVAACR